MNQKTPSYTGRFNTSGEALFECHNVNCLKDVRDEVVAPVVAAWCWIVVMPSLVVDRDPHLSWIAIVQAVGTAVVLVAPVVLWVRYVRVVIEAVEVL